MVSSDTMRGFNDLLILHLLLAQDSYGYQIAKEIALFSSDRYNIKETTLYSAFNRLEQNGLIRGYDGLETHGRVRTYYAITPVGKKALQEKQNEWNEIKSIIDSILNNEP